MAASKDLAIILTKLDPVKYKAIIDRAALNGYHDHKFSKIPGHSKWGEEMCPKVTLVKDLGEFPELEHIRQDVINGKYDDPADATDQEEMRGWLLDDNSGDEFFKILGLKVPTAAERQQHHKKKTRN